MKPSLTGNLWRAFPDFFREEVVPECGNGWAGLIVDACDELEGLGVDIYYTKIESRFGGLRFYFRINGIHDAEEVKKVFQIFNKYSQISNIICEECGDVADTSQQRIAKTLCRPCTSEAIFDYG